MLFLNIKPLFFHHIKENVLPNLAQVTCDDPVVVLRHAVKVHHILVNGITGSRSHTCPHIQRILKSEINDLACSDHCPGGGQRPLVSVSERKTEFFLRAAEMAGCHCHHIVTVSRGNGHGGQRECFPHGGAGAVQPIHRRVKPYDAKRGGNGLCQKIAHVNGADLPVLQLCLSDCHADGFFLKDTLCLLPGLAPEHAVLPAYHVKTFSQRAVPFLFPNYGGSA